jgi:hypothetical protein
MGQLKEKCKSVRDRRYVVANYVPDVIIISSIRSSDRRQHMLLCMPHAKPNTYHISKSRKVLPKVLTRAAPGHPSLLCRSSACFYTLVLSPKWSSAHRSGF